MKHYRAFMIVRMFYKVSALLVLMNITHCYKIKNENDNTENTEAVTESVGEVPNIQDVKFNTTMIHLSTKLDLANKRTDEIKNSKSNFKTIDIEELEILMNIISKICRVKTYKPCYGRDNEINHFTEGSPCTSCSCNPVQCPIAGNCCPDVEAQRVDEADASVVSPVCIQMYNTLPKQRPTKEVADNLEDSTGDSDNINPQQEINSDKVQPSYRSSGILEDHQGNRDNTEPQQERNSDQVQPSYTNTDKLEDRNSNRDNIGPQQRNSNEAQQSSTGRDQYEKATNDPERPVQHNMASNNGWTSDKRYAPQSEHSGITEEIKDNSGNDKSGNKEHDSTARMIGLKSKQNLTYQFMETNETTIYKQTKTEVKFPEFLVINKCPNSFNDTETVQHCEEGNSPELSAYIPVSAFLYLSPVVYKNKWCAECHNVTSVKNWAMVTDCMHFYQRFYLPSDVQDFLKIYQNCTAYTVPPLGWTESSQICRVKPEIDDDDVVVDKCNTTGDWESKDSVILELCESRSYLPAYWDATTMSQNVIYKNIFCFTCNTGNNTMATVNGEQTTDNNPESLLGDKHIYLPVNIVKEVNFMSTQTGEKSSTCLSGYVQDSYHDGCIPFQCPVYQTGVGYMCEDKYSSTVGLVLPATLSITFQGQPVNLENMEPVKFENMEPVKLENTEPVEIKTKEPVKLENMESVKLENTEPVEIKTKEPVNIENMESVKLENTEKEVTDFGHYLNDVIVDTLGLKSNRCNITYVRLLANYTNTSTRHVRKLYMEYQITNNKKCSVKTIVNTFDTIVSTNVTAMVHFATAVNTTEPFHEVRKTSTKISIGMEFGPVYNTHINKTLISSNPVSYEIKLHQAFNCPSVLLNTTYYKHLVENGSLIALAPSQLETIYTQTTGLVPICYGTYAFNWFADHYSQGEVEDESSVSNMLNLLSTLISMSSILMVLLTYFLFPDLHFVPGKLFMMLCVNLFTAQGLFTFGIGLDVDNGWCQFIGMLIHFFWLATIFSMNSNLILMFSNIKHPLGTSSREMIQSRSNSTVCKYMVYCYSMSAVWVLTNVIISRALLHDDHYGYGGNFCYINTPIMRITTFTLPLLLVLLANFVMFTLIITQISASMYKRYCFVFKSTVLMVLKLSTITGVFWMFGFLYEATGMPLFEYLFTLLQAGQGFFLMTTYIFNKRVLNLYKAKFRACTTKGKRYDITVFPNSNSL